MTSHLVSDFARRIEHTLLRADAAWEQVKALIDEAGRFGFYSVCVSPCHVKRARQRLGSGPATRLTTVVGFPLGFSTAETKTYEAMRMAEAGATDLDIVMNIGAAAQGDWRLVTDEIASIVTATSGAGLVRKVIIEACFLKDAEKKQAVSAAIEAGAEYVKTSTGFGASGATAADVALMKEAASGKALVKAAGGIRTLKDALDMVAAGADLIGTSSGAAIMDELYTSRSS